MIIHDPDPDWRRGRGRRYGHARLSIWLVSCLLLRNQLDGHTHLRVWFLVEKQDLDDKQPLEKSDYVSD